MTPFDAVYWAYTRSPVGRVVHWFNCKFAPEAHSSVDVQLACGGRLAVLPVPCLEDNYSYVVVDCATGESAVVDACDADRVLAALRRVQAAVSSVRGGVARGDGVGAARAALVLDGWSEESAAALSEVRGEVRVQFVLSTHSHQDHAGGNAALLRAFAAADRPKVVAPTYEYEWTPAPVDRCVGHGEVLRLGATLIEAFAIPCHTPGHLAFVASAADAGPAPAPPPALFSGDALFVGGVGKFFEAGVEGLWTAVSLFRDGGPACLLPSGAAPTGAASPLPGNAAVFPGHEYAMPNAAFATWLLPDDRVMQDFAGAMTRARAERRGCVPATWAQELRVNPFLRCHQPEVVRAVGRAWERTAARSEALRADMARRLTRMRELRGRLLSATAGVSASDALRDVLGWVRLQAGLEPLEAGWALRAIREHHGAEMLAMCRARILRDVNAHELDAESEL